jgi:2,3-bisphosphoglycerate-independent phosphoglycerate mutase
MTDSTRKPLVLIVRDGWGENPHPEHAPFNAVEVARRHGRVPTDDMLRREWPWTLVKTSGEDVGLPGTGESATMGNSEVGHQNIGAGRIVAQESLVMTRACETGLHMNPALRAAVERCLRAQPDSERADKLPALHLMGINSDAGVHGLLEHLHAILRACKTLGLTRRVYVHLFTDGRDTGPYTGVGYAERVEGFCTQLGVGRIASVAGRYYAMDRDHRWERVQLAYDCLTGRGVHAGAGQGREWTAPGAIQHYYDHPSGPTLKGDEFVTPTPIGGRDEVAASRVRDGDSVIFYNYRGDRPRELSAAFCFPDNAWAKVKPSPESGKIGFDRGPKLDLHYVIMTEYWEALLPFVQGVAFPRPPKMVNILGDYLSKLGLGQFRCAETEKYPHVTFFFNDYRDEPFPGERRENPQSPNVPTYDLKPEMSAGDVCDGVLRRLGAPDCESLLVVNFANGDMVGHTGNLEAAVKACATVDACVGRIVDATLKRGGQLIVTADHGNCEQMFDPRTNSPHTSHTIYDVPLFVVGAGVKGRSLRGDRDPKGWFDGAVRSRRGRLADIAPTALEMMGLKKPGEMAGTTLLA